MEFYLRYWLKMLGFLSNKVPGDAMKPPCSNSIWSSVNCPVSAKWLICWSEPLALKNLLKKQCSMFSQFSYALNPIFHIKHIIFESNVKNNFRNAQDGLKWLCIGAGQNLLYCNIIVFVLISVCIYKTHFEHLL